MATEIQKYLIKDVEQKDYQISTARLNAPIYKPSQKAQEVIKNTWQRYSEIRTNRDLNYRWFGKKRDSTYRTLIEYINICEKRWNSDGIPRTNLEEWQASVFKPETRNKIMAILSAVAQQRPKVNFRGREKSDYLREQILRDLYDWSEDKDNGDEMALYTMLDAIIHGTAVRYEGYEDCRKVIKELAPGEEGYDLYDLKFKEKVVLEKKLFAREVRLQDFYFGSLSTRRMEDQPDCVWRKVMRFNDFKREFNGWDESKYVLPGGDLTDETFYSNFTSDEVRERESDLVEVLRYYSKEADEFVILANGVWVNPIGRKVSPIPFAHKELPFFTVLFEPFASDFPYGKAAPDKYLGEQDAINALYNMLLDQTYVSIHKPLITGDEDFIDDVDLLPGKVNYIGADVANVQELQISPPANAHFNMLQLLHNSLQESSVDAAQQGISSEAKTATAVRQAASAAARTFLLFLEFVYYGYKRKAQLRTKNILQFLTSPSEIEKVLGDDGEEKFNEAFQAFKLNDVSLSNGKQGSRIIELVDRETLTKRYGEREKERAELEPQNMEKIYILPEYIRDGFEWDVEMVPNSSIKETPEILRALELEFQQIALTNYGDMINREAMFDDFLEVFEKDKQRLKIQSLAQSQITPQAINGQGGTNVAKQIISNSIGGQQRLGTNKPSLNQLTQ